MKTIEVEQCPVNGKAGTPALVDVADPFFGTGGRWTYWREPVTGHLWLNPRPADCQIPSLYTQYYTHRQKEGPERSTWAQATAEVLHSRLGYAVEGSISAKAKLLARLPTVAAAAEMEVLRLPAGERGRLLDFGCGDGTFMARMADSGWEVAGVEPDEKAVTALRHRFGFDIRPSLADGPDWRLSFDVVTMNHVVEHVPDPIETLGRCAALLKSGGRLIITTPNAQSLGARLFGRNWRGLEPPRHFNIFTVASLRETLRAAGLHAHALVTTTRLARGIYPASYWASKGRKRIELEKPGGRAVKIAGYGFQIIEGALSRSLPNLGEELFCVAHPIVHEA